MTVVWGYLLGYQKGTMTDLKDITITPIAPEGLGFGEGAISYKDRAEQDVPVEELKKVEAIITEPAKILVDIDQEDGDYIDDDGCGDGRGATESDGAKVYIKQGDNFYKKSLNRAKVFGGAPAMAAAAMIALDAHKPEEVTELFVAAMDELDEHDIDYGAHTDEHAGEANSGCGAIDNAPLIIDNVAKFQEQIKATIKKIIPDVDLMTLDEVIDAFVSYAENKQSDGYRGQAVMDEIDAREKVIKRLVKDHNEMYVILNEVEHQTVNQFTVRDASHEVVQTFAVDLWRLADINARLYVDEVESQDVAFTSQLVYTLATAATLTDGTLPVYKISETAAKITL